MGGAGHAGRASTSSCSSRTGIISRQSWNSRCRAFRRSRSAGIKQLINGPESFTPDGNFILGEAPEVRGVFVAAGFNAFGIASGGGAGHGAGRMGGAGASRPTISGRSTSAASAATISTSTGCGRARSRRTRKHYTMAWPFEEYSSGRPLRRSPLYDRLKAQGAVFGEKLGWERPNWFADAAAGETAEDVYSYGRQNWFEAVGREHRAARERVGAVRPDLVRQVPDGRPRRGGSALLDLRQRRRQAAGLRSPTRRC